MSTTSPPPTGAAEQWRQIEDSAVPRQRVLATSAAIIADELTDIGPKVSHDAGGRTEYWYRVALAAHELLHETCTYANQSDAHARCRLDPATVRAWLAAPAADPGHDGATVADEIGITEGFHIRDPDLDHHLTRLFDAISRAGHFTVPGYAIETWHLAGRSGHLDGHLIVARQPNMSGLASIHLRGTDLIHLDLSGIDAAVNVLERAAAIVNDLLGFRPDHDSAEEAAPAPTPTEDSIPKAAQRSVAAQAFPDLDLHEPASTPAPAPPATPPASGRHP